MLFCFLRTGRQLLCREFNGKRTETGEDMELSHSEIRAVPTHSTVVYRNKMGEGQPNQQILQTKSLQSLVIFDHKGRYTERKGLDMLIHSIETVPSPARYPSYACLSTNLVYISFPFNVCFSEKSDRGVTDMQVDIVK